MSDFKAKMHQIQFRLALCPRPWWGSLEHSPRGPTSKGEGNERGEEGEEGDGKGVYFSFLNVGMYGSLDTGEAPSFTESHSRWAQPYRVGIVAMGIRLLFK